MNDFDKYYEAEEPGRRERAYGWATAIGLQDVDGLKPSHYLIETAKRNIEGEISADEARRLDRPAHGALADGAHHHHLQHFVHACGGARGVCLHGGDDGGV